VGALGEQSPGATRPEGMVSPEHASVSWSPDGQRLATGSEDGTATVWQAASGRELLILKGHTSSIHSVSWSPDGQRLATGSEDGTAKVWEAATAAAVQAWARQERALEQLLALHAFRGPQAQGFLQDWLLLVPLSLAPGESGAEDLAREQLPGEAQLRPRAGQRVPLGGQERVWEAHRAPQAVLDFNAVLGRVADWGVAYAVCYLDSDRARDKLWLEVGSDDQAKVYLNGEDVYKYPLPRALAGGLDKVGPVALRPGTNVLVFKVVNEGGGWEGCVRLVDAEGRPVQGIQVRLRP
jgi:dipeptidyl aminopeptidase/acylaminoacyl peptidase